MVIKKKKKEVLSHNSFGLKVSMLQKAKIKAHVGTRPSKTSQTASESFRPASGIQTSLGVQKD